VGFFRFFCYNAHDLINIKYLDTGITYMNEDLLLIKQLEALRDQHRDLDDKIKINGIDEFSKQRFKKMKLQLRDEINKLERIVYPDIIA